MRLYDPANKTLNMHLQNFVGSKSSHQNDVKVVKIADNVEKNKWVQELLNEFNELGAELPESSEEEEQP